MVQPSWAVMVSQLLCTQSMQVSVSEDEHRAATCDAHADVDACSQLPCQRASRGEGCRAHGECEPLAQA